MDNAEINKQVTTNIENAMEQRHMSMLQVATDAAIPYTTLHRKMKGVGSFSLDELARIAIALEVSPGALIPAPFKAETGQAS